KLTNKKIILKIFDQLFFNVENIGHNMRILIRKRLNNIYENKGDRLFNLNQKISIQIVQFENEFEQFFFRHEEYHSLEYILSNLALPFIDILSLIEFCPNEMQNKFLNDILHDLQTIQNSETLICLKEKVLLELLNSYSNFTSVSKHIKTKDLSIDEKLEILKFFYEELQTKSTMIKQIYYNFYSYCQTQTCNFPFKKLVYLIRKVRQDSLELDNQINNDFIKFQIVVLDTVLNKTNPLCITINDELVDFLIWLFKLLSEYECIDDIENVNLQMKHIEQLNKLCLNVNKLSEKEYKFLRDSISSIHRAIKKIYVEKIIKFLFKQNSNAKWLEVIIYFPEFFEDNNEFLFNSIVKYSNEINKIQTIIFERTFEIQEKKLENFYKLISKENDDFKNKIELNFKDFSGYLNKQDKNFSFDRQHPYEVLSFNTLIDTFNDRLEIDRGLLISENSFLKIQKCLSCFEDIYIAIDKLSNSFSQYDWLKIVLIEHIIEKYRFIYSEMGELENLHNLLIKTDEKLLILFNNVFISQYSDQINQAIYSKINSNSIPNYQKITKEKFLIIIQLISKIKATKKNLDQLSDASLSVWNTLLYEIEFSQVFNIEMNRCGIELNEDGVEKALLFLNRIRIKLGIENNEKFLDFFESLANKIIQSNVKTILQLNKLLEAIHYEKISFEEGNKIIRKFDYVDWPTKIEKIILSKYLNHDISDRSAKEIVNQMISEQNDKTNRISRKILEKIADETMRLKKIALKKRILEGNEKSEILREIQNIFNLKTYQENPSAYVYSHLDQIIPLIFYAWSIANKPQFPKDSQIVAFLLFVHSNNKGLLEQVRTGEGKTLIVGLTAAFFALCGYAVDIVSSNRDLAIEGERKCRAFFQLLKIESGHICSENDDVNHQSYRSDLNTPQGNIVYGEVGAFQKDILEEEFNDKKIFGKRYENRQKCLIVDEVDNMCLDRARHVLYLSHEIESLKCLETLFINIWAAVLRVEINNVNDMSDHIEDISQFIKQHIQNKNIFVPEYMHDFVNNKIKRWVDSAFQARIMREDDHFVIDIRKIDDPSNNKKQKSIIVVDKDTGIEQYSTRWSHGLAQFLELKYRRKLSVESLKAVFISNKAFFQRYKNHLYGLTGTLGSENSQNFLSDLYHVHFADIPTSRKKLYYQYPSKVSFEYSDWLNLIAKESIEYALKRPVLIICENVEATENIWNELIRHGVPPHTIEKYRRDGDNVEGRFRKKSATIGDIIIATNKGGRGTDIHVDSEVDKDGGMHVILSYLPENVRIEEQAFGRTARNGAAGTGQFILQVDKLIYEKIYELDQYPSDQQQKELEELSDIILEREKMNRDNKEAARLSELKEKNILRLEVEEELFDKFNRFKRDIAKNLFEKIFSDKETKSKEKFIEVLEKILKDRWAFWLDEMKEKIDSIETFQQKDLLLIEYDTSFIKKMTNLLERTDFNNLIEKFIQKPEEAIHIAKVCFSENEYLMARKCLEKAVQCGDYTGFSHIGLAYAIIQLETEVNIKKQVRKELKKALNCLESVKRNLMANIKIAEILPQSATTDVFIKVSPKENFYQEQITGKLEVIGLHLHYIKAAIGDTVEPFDFIFHTENEDKMKKENYSKGENLYNLLVEKGLIQGDRIRKVIRNDKTGKEKENMEKIIRDNLDPSIVDSLIQLLNTKDEFKKIDFEDIVCYNEQLWKILNIKKFENVFILDKNRIENDLVQEYESVWKDLENNIDPNQVDISLFDQSSEKKKFKIYLEEKQILIQTKRVKINELDFESLKFQGKYSKIKFNENGYETKDLKAFLIELKDYISQESEYFYQTDLPFGTKEEEVNKIRIFLKEKNILKSGGLAIHKYGNKREEINELLDKILKNTVYENDKNLIQSILSDLQGDIRSYTDELKATFKDFIDLQEPEVFPSELNFFEGSGLNKFLIIKEDKSWWDWNAFAVAMIGLAQVIGGTVLTIFGFVNIGPALIAEGIADMVYATVA
ncbi:unnamed protein product, partial [Rotaria sordida]